MRQVAVIGSSKAKPEEEEYKIAYELGKEIAQREGSYTGQYLRKVLTEKEKIRA